MCGFANVLALRPDLPNSSNPRPVHQHVAGTVGDRSVSVSRASRKVAENSSRKDAAAVAAVCDRRNSITYEDATLIERRYSAFFGNLPRRLKPLT